jgi:putative SOS response-associated peptidase YedK
MCSRYVAAFTDEQLRAAGFAGHLPRYHDRYNFQNGMEGLMGTKDGEVMVGTLASWGRQKSADTKAAPSIARGENVPTSGIFKTAFQQRRCVVPAIGFFEWELLGTGAKAAKQPWYIHRTDGGMMWFAGLWEESDGGWISYTIVTTRANSFMRSINDRMPVILEQDQVNAWLSSPEVSLMAPAADGVLSAHKVGARINSTEFDEPSLTEPEREQMV